VSGLLATGVMAASFGFSAATVYKVLGLVPVEGVRSISENYYTWLSSGPLQIPLSFRVDPLTCVMLLVITGIGTLIHLYSTAYMHDESDGEYARYFSYLNLFAAVHARAGPGRELPGDVHRLGRGWPLLVPADWVLVHEALGRRGR
jgi:NADH-quinone oxidoreductase subunit L